jgi:hypothetical protein
MMNIDLFLCGAPESPIGTPLGALERSTRVGHASVPVLSFFACETTFSGQCYPYSISPEAIG